LDDDDERRAMMKKLTDILQPTKTKERSEKQRQFGFTPEQFATSPMNPFL